jgi:hypothetical protein
MSSIRIRPRFKISSTYTANEILEKIKTNLSQSGTEFYAESLLSNLVIIRMKEEHLKLWSPQLSLSMDNSENETIIRGLYGPKPTIWSFFIFLYTGIGVCVLFAGLYGLAKLSLKMEAPVLWLIPVLLGFALLLYILAQTGQKLSAQQMFDIHHFFEKTIDKKIYIR